jgi:glycosyltransferase involved in cell wall biosynthesis
LRAIEQQTLALENIELILVDNGSGDPMDPTVLPPFARMYRCQTPGSYAARNVGAMHAQGQWLVFTDADCVPDRDWLAALQAAARSERSFLLAGPVSIVSYSERPNWSEVYDMVRGIPQAHYVKRGYAATANLAVLKKVFDALGGFDGRRYSGGDAEFCRRAGVRGCGTRFVERAAVAHPTRNTWEELSTKARRVKGGQLTAGSLRRRTLWHLATCLPPIRESWRLLRNRAFPKHYRLIAVAIQLRLWLVQIAEMLRLLAGRVPERR